MQHSKCSSKCYWRCHVHTNSVCVLFGCPWQGWAFILAEETLTLMITIYVLSTTNVISLDYSQFYLDHLCLHVLLQTTFCSLSTLYRKEWSVHWLWKEWSFFQTVFIDYGYFNTLANKKPGGKYCWRYYCYWNPEEVELKTSKLLYSAMAMRIAAKTKENLGGEENAPLFKGREDRKQ